MSVTLGDACHIWGVDLAVGTGSISLLDEAERDRAARLRFTRDRERFTAARVALRRILGGYLDCDPARIALRRGEHGRPYLAESQSLEFNVSHSEDLALVAVSAHAPLGVDVEALREVARTLELAQRQCHTDELQALEDAPPSERSAAFLTCWTRKEAVLKSIGVGLTRDTQVLNVGVSMREWVLELPQFPPLRLISFTPMQGYIAACAAAPAVRAFEFRRFEP